MTLLNASGLSETVRLGAVELTWGDRQATLVLDRPPLNILDLDALADLAAGVTRLSARPELQLVVIRGRGERAFSAGVAIGDHTPERVAPMLDRFHGALRGLLALDAVTLAVVRGHCLGGGLELALTCDLVLASDDSRLGQPEIELGCYPPWAAALYPLRLGLGQSADLLLTGRTLSAAEAERIGLINRAVPAADLDSAALDLAQQLTAKSGAALRLAKRALRASYHAQFLQALAQSEQIYRDQLAETHDLHEGVQAFLAKRPPCWQHR